MVLIIKPEWGEKILNGEKRMEIRRNRCLKHVGKRIGLCFSGTSAVYGFVDFVANMGPLSGQEWDALRPWHCVPGDALPYGKNTCGWVMARPERLANPMRIERSATVIWQPVHAGM